MTNIVAALLLLSSLVVTTAQESRPPQPYPGHRPQEEEKEVAGKWIGIVCIKQTSPVVVKLKIAPDQPNRRMSIEISEGIAKFPSEDNPKVLVWKTYPLDIHVTSRIMEDYEQGWTLQGSSDWMALDPRNQGRKAVLTMLTLAGERSVLGSLRAKNGQNYTLHLDRDNGDPLEAVVRKKAKTIRSECLDW